jgi:putative ABC transport system permease protein
LLVTVEIAVSAVLLVAASLLVRGVVKSQTTDPGFETRHVIGPMGLWFSNDPAKSNELARRVIGRLSELPVVRSVGLVYRAPWSGTWTPPVRIEETKAAPKNLPWQVLANYVCAPYFTALSIPIVRGRNFSRYEGDSGAPVAIVSESAARRFWPGEEPIGKRISLDMTFKGNWARFQVIGVAKDVRTANLSRVDPGYVYLATDASKMYTYEALIRIEGDRTGALASVRNALEDLDHTRFPRGMWLDTLAEGPLRTQKMVPQAIAGFAVSLGVLALLLATVGVYGVVSYAVGGSTHEIGVRMALGATRSDVLHWALRQKRRPVVLGGVTGLALSLGLSTLLRAALAVPGSPDLLFGASPFDGATFAGAFALLGGLALIACYIPARRAAKVDPMEALRYE